MSNFDTPPPQTQPLADRLVRATFQKLVQNLPIKDLPYLNEIAINIDKNLTYYSGIALVVFLVIPIYLAFRLGKRRANRAKYFSKKLATSRKYINRIKKSIKIYKRNQKLISSTISFLLISVIIFSCLFFLDYFFLFGLFFGSILKVVDFKIFVAILAVVLGFNYLLKRLLGYMSAIEKRLKEKVYSEEKLVMKFTQKFIKGLGGQYQDVLKDYFVKNSQQEFVKVKENFDRLELDYNQEKEGLEAIDNLWKFYREVVSEINDFEWCSECRSVKTRARGISNIKTLTEASLFNPNSEAGNQSNSDNKSKNGKIEAGNGVDGAKGLGKIRRRNSKLRKTKQRSLSAQKDGSGKVLDADSIDLLKVDQSQAAEALKDRIVCKALCLRKYFGMMVNMRKKFERNSHLFEVLNQDDGDDVDQVDFSESVDSARQEDFFESG